ncbi:MAG: type II and III secretion system protein family protein [Alphaproteobacteria bacterium]|nr:type II and III secretion system protein family protein [Alphaproteobacteria bacterium]
MRVFYTYCLCLVFMGMITFSALNAFAAPLPIEFEEPMLQVEINKGQTIKLPRAASSVMVADPATADVQVVSPTLLFVHGKKVGETSIYAVDNQDNQIYSTTIQVTHNISNLQRAIRRIAPDADVDVKTVDGGMVLGGFAGSAAESENIRSVASAFIGDKEKMMNMINTAGSDQVTLQVKIVEMSRDDVKKFGINLASILSRGNFGLQLLNGPDIALTAAGVLDRDGSSNSALLGKFGTKNTNISGLIDALETQGLANVLAEPSLTTESGKTAKFLAGGQFPIPVRDGNGSVTIQYKDFGVGLNFTPIVMSKDRISINVAPEVSTISFDNPIEVAGIKNPIIMTRKAESTVELGSGQTFALAGLLKNEASNSVDKFPGLGDMPVLGSLFRSQSFQNNRTELVILVTPYIVRPVSDHSKMQTPDEGYVPPSDLQRIMHGSLYQQQPMNKEDDLPALNGEGGFIQE